MWVPKVLDSIAQIVPVSEETDSISLKYIRTLKTMKGIYLWWSKIIEELTFAVIEAKVKGVEKFEII